MVNKRLWFFIAGLLVIIGNAAFCGGTAEPPPAVPVSLSGSITYLEGEVSLNGEKANFGSPVGSGDVVETGPASTCEIVFNKRNIVRMRENSLIHFAPENLTEGIEVKRGALIGVIDRLSAEVGRGSMKVRTPTTVAGIRGTAFFIKVVSENDTYFCICNGELELGNITSGPIIDVRSERHTAYRYTRTADGIISRKATLLYHDDEDVEEVAKKIDVRIDWGSSYSGY